MQTSSSSATSNSSQVPQDDVVAGESEPHKLTKESDVPLGTKKHHALAENKVRSDQLEGPDSFNNICDEGASTSGIMSPLTTSKEIQKHVLSVTTDSMGDFGSLMPNDLQYDQIRKHDSLQDTIPICNEAKASTTGISGLITLKEVQKKYVDYNVASESVSECESLDSELSGTETARLADMGERMVHATKEVEGKSRKQRRVKTCLEVRNAHECDEENCSTCGINVAKTFRSQIYFSKENKRPKSQRETAFLWQMYEQKIESLQQENQQLKNQRDGRIETGIMLQHAEADKRYLKYEKSIRVLKEKNEGQQAAMETLRTQLITVTGERETFKTELATVKAKLAKTKDKLTNERKLGIREVGIVKAELDATKGELVIVKAGRDAATGELVTVKANQDSAKCELAAVKTECDAAKGELITVKAARDAATGELVTVKAERDSAKCELAL